MKTEVKSKATTKAEDSVNNVDGKTELNDDFRRNVTYKLARGNEIYNLCLNMLVDPGSPISFVKEGFTSDKVIENCHNKFLKFKGINGSEI